MLKTGVWGFLNKPEVKPLTAMLNLCVVFGELAYLFYLGATLNRSNQHLEPSEHCVNGDTGSIKEQYMIYAYVLTGVVVLMAGAKLLMLLNGAVANYFKSTSWCLSLIFTMLYYDSWTQCLDRELVLTGLALTPALVLVAMCLPLGLYVTSSESKAPIVTGTLFIVGCATFTVPFIKYANYVPTVVVTVLALAELLVSSLPQTRSFYHNEIFNLQHMRRKPPPVSHDPGLGATL